MSKKRELKFYNGRWHDESCTGQGHAYIAAYSRADAVRVVTEYLGYEVRGMNAEIRDYWSECWGNPMDDVVPERGMWVSGTDFSKPVRVTLDGRKRHE